ncbi:MAG: hypothetical protein U9Q34_04175 [Elusimicrobiota bacterium]|nr:hypothetical protein [Elusimicrobiota bacterium]
MWIKIILALLIFGQPSLCLAKSANDYIKKAKAAVDSNTRVYIYKKAIKEHPRDPRLYHERGVAYGIIEYHDKAVADFSKAIELRSSYALAYKNRALAYHRIKKFKESVSDCKKFIEFEPKDAFGYYLLGVNYANLGGKWPETETNINKAIELDSSYKDKSSVRKIKYQIKKRKKTSLSFGSKKTPEKKTSKKKPEPKTPKQNSEIKTEEKPHIIYKKKPASRKTKVLLRRAGSRMRLKKYAEALSLYEEAIEREADVPFIYAARGFAKLRLEKVEEGISDIAKALKMQPDCAKAFLYRAYVKIEMGDSSGAQEDLDTALSIDGKIKKELNYRRAKRALRKLKRELRKQKRKNR